MIRPPNTRCETCLYWAAGEDPEIRLGECRRHAPDASEARVAGLRVMGSEALHRFVDDDEASPAARAEVKDWLARNERRLPAYQPRVRVATWHPTLADHWCGDHPKFSQES